MVCEYHLSQFAIFSYNAILLVQVLMALWEYI